MVEKRVIIGKDAPVHKTKHLRKQMYDTEKAIHEQEKMILELKQKINLIRKIGGKDYVKARQDLKTAEHQLTQFHVDLKKLQKEEAAYTKQLRLTTGTQRGVK
ncbi:MAG: hypothetical protein JXA43_01485 [Candidatus Diapherotrites archaeon]|nr:hypothetical protein [Candidatus Diapherotrites archaeon]